MKSSACRRGDSAHPVRWCSPLSFLCLKHPCFVRCVLSFIAAVRRRCCTGCCTVFFCTAVFDTCRVKVLSVPANSLAPLCKKAGCPRKVGRKQSLPDSLLTHLLLRFGYRARVLALDQIYGIERTVDRVIAPKEEAGKRNHLAATVSRHCCDETGHRPVEQNPQPPAPREKNERGGEPENHRSKPGMRYPLAKEPEKGKIQVFCVI